MSKPKNALKRHLKRSQPPAAVPAPAQLPAVGFVREREVLKVFPVSRSTWRTGIAEGRYPAPVKLGERAVGWKVGDINALIERLSAGEAAAAV